MKFCRKLTPAEHAAGRLPTGHEYTLPTEAQREFACRAETVGMSYLGDFRILGAHNAPALDSIAWYGGNSGAFYDGGYDSSDWLEMQYPHNQAGTHAVGGKAPNALGLYEMLGNADEPPS